MAFTTTGFEPKRLATVETDLATKMRAEVDSNLTLTSDSLAGHLLKIIALMLAAIWELAAAMYNAFHPANAAGVALDNLVALGGLVRRPATRTTGTVTLTGTAGVVVGAGAIVRHATTKERYLIFATVTIGAGGTVAATVVAETPGALTADAGTITEIVTKISGWTAITNAAALTTGKDVETDSELRRRWERSKQIASGATEQAVRAAIEEISTVTSATVISNRTAVTDGNGLPPHSYRIVIAPGSGHDATLIAETIWDKGPAGIESDGSVSYDVTDAQGYTQTVKWSYVSNLTLYVKVEVTKGANYAGDAAVKAAVKAITDELAVGDDVNPFVLAVAVGKLSGVTLAVVKAGASDPPTSTAIYATAFDVQPVVGDNITVVSS